MCDQLGLECFGGVFVPQQRRCRSLMLMRYMLDSPRTGAHAQGQAEACSREQWEWVAKWVSGWLPTVTGNVHKLSQQVAQRALMSC